MCIHFIIYDEDVLARPKDLKIDQRVEKMGGVAFKNGRTGVVIGAIIWLTKNVQMIGRESFMKSQKERMLAGELYIAHDEELGRENHHAKRVTRLFNQTTEDQPEERQRLLKQLFKQIGPGSYVEPPFHTDYGTNTTIGKNFYANYDAIFVDCGPITIGDNVFLGPRVGLYTAGHPIDAAIRNEQLEYGKGITIGNGVWIGGNAVLNPGVHIGNNVVIGSGSIVTHDIPDNVVAAGNPCRVLRRINEEDHERWEREKAAYYADRS